MVKSPGKHALSAAGLRYITALTDPQIRRLRSQGTSQESFFNVIQRRDTCTPLFLLGIWRRSALLSSAGSNGSVIIFAG